MLRTNLSTRPFYNERGVFSALLALAVIAAGLTVFNAYDILRLKGAPLGKRDFLGRMRLKK